MDDKKPAVWETKGKKIQMEETIHESPTDKHELGLLKKEIGTAE